MKSYKAVIRYTDKKSTYTYGVLYGTILGDDVYLASAMVLSDDQQTLEGIKSRYTVSSGHRMKCCSLRRQKRQMMRL